jgi:predicted  nucleic acid-binding Zn-ribbon protein
MLTLVENPSMRGGTSATQWRERFRALRERIERIETHLAGGPLTDESRVRELESSRDRLALELEALEEEADRAEVPAGWRE